jgi:uncharacterized protein HemX
MLHSSREALAGRSSAAISASLLVAATMALGASGTAAAQDAGFGAALQRKFDILQQQTDSARIRAEAARVNAEAEHERAQAEATPREAQSRQTGGSEHYRVTRGTDDFAGMRVPTYRLANGVILEVTGDFWPDGPTVCIANCP